MDRPTLRKPEAEIIERLERSRLSQTALANHLGLNPNKISKVKAGERRMKGEELDAARAWLDEQEKRVSAGKRAPEPDIPPTKSADAGETAAVMRLDLSYSMGPGTDLDLAHVEGEPVQFDISYLRSLTPSPPDRLRIVTGVGDSMLPTIHDREELIIDLNQTRLNMQDRIWAIALYGAGAVKRLRTIGKQRVLVISDNPDVPDQEVDAADLFIAARVVGSLKRH